MTRRFWWSLALTLPILAVMVSEFLPGQPIQHAVSPEPLNWIELALATPVVLWGGWPFFVRGWASIVSRHLNMFTLIALGVGAAYGFSVVATMAPGLFPHSFRMHGGVARVFRARGRHRRARAARSGARAARAKPDERGDSQSARAGAKNSAAHRGGWPRARRSARRCDVPAIGCASGRVNAFRSMASCWKGTRSSTSRW